jgi:hypothetical protein
MTLREYFENTTGRGVLATAGLEGNVDAAVYSRPHFIDDETVAYIMTDRLSHANLQTNPHAAYLFIENGGEKTNGKRLYLKKIKEETDPEAIRSIAWRKSYVVPKDQEQEKLFLVYFRIEAVRPLLGK